MKKWIPILSLLLVAQLAAALAVNLAGEGHGAFRAEEPLLVFDKTLVDRLSIEGAAQSVLLERQEGRWRLPELGDFPADSDSVQALLGKLSSLKKGWPVATTAGAARRFKVDDDLFERRLTLWSGGEQVAELYVGTSPGFRKVHVRPAGEEAVLAAAFNAWEASPKPDDWIDKDLLRLSEGDIQTVELPGLRLEREGKMLKPADLASGEEADDQAIRSLIGQLANLRIQSLIGSGDRPDYAQDEPDLQLAITRKDGARLVYRFFKPDEGSFYALQRSDLPYWLKVADFTVKAVEEAQRDKLVRRATAQTGGSGSEPEEEQPAAPEASGAAAANSAE
jgi:hypothetical protein